MRSMFSLIWNVKDELAEAMEDSNIDNVNRQIWKGWHRKFASRLTTMLLRFSIHFGDMWKFWRAIETGSHP